MRFLLVVLSIAALEVSHANEYHSSETNDIQGKDVPIHEPYRNKYDYTKKPKFNVANEVLKRKKNLYDTYEKDWKSDHKYEKSKKFMEKKTSRYSEPPDHRKLIPMARYVVHNANWASIATISTISGIEGFPFSNVKSMVDGSITNSTGVPYFYISPLDFTARDLMKNSHCTVMATLEETTFCHDKNYDPEDPRCTRLMLTGKMKRVKENTTEHEFAKKALFERHPAMANFPPDHDFFVAKLKIAMIAMVDWFGGAKYIPVRDYLTFNFTAIDPSLVDDIMVATNRL